MKCQFCHAPIPTSSVSCFHCGRLKGEPLPAGPPLAAPAQLRPKSGSGMVLGLALVALLMTAGGAGFFLLHSSATPPPPPGVFPPPPTPAPEPPPALPPAKTWDGTTPFECDAGEHALAGKQLDFGAEALGISDECRVTLEDCTLRATRQAIRIRGRGRLVMKGGSIGTSIRAEDDAEVTLENVSVNGGIVELLGRAKLDMRAGSIASPALSLMGALRADDTARAALDRVTSDGTVDARDNAQIRITRGIIRGKPSMMGRGPVQSIRADGNAVVTRFEAVIEGAIGEHGGGVVIELKEGDDAEAKIRDRRALTESRDRYEGQACSGVIECFTNHDASGNVHVHLLMPIGEDGKAVGARVLKSLGATPPVARCLTQLATKKQLENFVGPKGKLECRLAGMIMGGTQSISIARKFTPNP